MRALSSVSEADAQGRKRDMEDYITPQRGETDGDYGGQMGLQWLLVQFVGWMEKGKNARKIRRARAEILPRNPNALICPSCYEVLERL